MCLDSYDGIIVSNDWRSTVTDKEYLTSYIESNTERAYWDGYWFARRENIELYLGNEPFLITLLFNLH